MLYGAGDLGELFLSHLKTTHAIHFNEMRIIGFLDDHPNLKRRVLDGFRIYGSIDDLPQLVERFNLHGIVVTLTNLDPERADQLNQVVEQYGLTLYRWRPQLHLVKIESHEVLAREIFDHEIRKAEEGGSAGL
jgi:UDP-GlcNAc:undecaprenyl-phosphate/decaprenyl-phosphate GlcNAc-1-phosphate transferase